MAKVITADEFTNNEIRTVRKCLAKLDAKQTAIQRYENYYSGNHPFNFASAKFRSTFGERLRNMRDNLCKTVVKAPADRLEVIGFGSDKSSAVYNTSWEIWKRSQMPQMSKRVHRDAFKTGNGFVVVWFGADGKAAIVKQDPRNCAVFYNPETNRVEIGAKIWRGIDDFIYLTVYYPDRIEKYISKRTYKENGNTFPKTIQAFARRTVGAGVDVDGKPINEPWPVPNNFNRCPMFHFGLESSILDDVIPLNDALNKSIADLLVSSEANSLRQRWSAGISYETDEETGDQIIPFKPTSQWATTADSEAKFGAFPDATLADFLNTIKDFRSEIASVAGIPHYYFEMTTGDFPSGEALTKAESRFTSTIEDAQGDFGEPWAGVMELALLIDGHSIDDDKTPADSAQDDVAAGESKTGSQIETQWKPAAPMSENEKWDLAQKKKTVGLSIQRILSELGYSDADIKKIMDEASANTEASAQAFQKVFDAGGQVGG